jgi:hypothetical protein
VATVVVVLVLAAGGAADARTEADVVAAVRAATVRYLDIERARADGYVQVSDMERHHGYHFLRPGAWAWSVAAGALSADLDLQRPPVLLYVRRADAWQLVGVEYALPARPRDDPFPGARWEEHVASCHYRDYREIPRGSAGECPARHPETGAPFVLFHPAMAVVHVWAWHPNPAGPFAAANPYLAPYGGGTAHPHERSGPEIAYSELNHRTAGAILALIAGAMFWQARRPRSLPWSLLPAVLWVGLGVYLFVRSDPEAWPWGPKRFAEIFDDLEVLQHKVLTLLPVGIGILGALRATGRLTWTGFRHGPAVLAVLGGLGLLVHVHDGAFHLDRIYVQHAVMGLAGLAFGAVALTAPRRLGLERVALPVLVLAVAVALLVYFE